MRRFIVSRLALLSAARTAGLLLLSSPFLSAAFQLLPGYFLWQDNGSPLSADGNVAVVQVTINGQTTFARWTAAGGAQALAVPTGAKYWDRIEGVNADGSKIVGGGMAGAAQNFAYQAWVWSNGTTSVVSANNSDNASAIAVNPTGSYVLIEYRPFSGSNSYVRRYSSGITITLSKIENGAFRTNVSEDANVRIGAYPNPYKTSQLLPAFWKGFDSPFVGSAFVNLPSDSVAEFCSRDGRVIVGSSGTGVNLPDYGEATRGFIWRPSVNQVEFHSPPGFITVGPGFISPDGDIVAFSGWLDPYHSKTVVYDSTTAATKAKGYQDISAWLVDEGYLTASDLSGRQYFGIQGMSDDRKVVVGNFYANNAYHAYRATKP